MKSPWKLWWRIIAFSGVMMCSQSTALAAAAAVPINSVFLSVEKKTGPYTNESKDGGKGVHYAQNGYTSVPAGNNNYNAVPNYTLAGSSSTTNTERNNVWYTLTLRNQAATPISGLMVTYHIYVKTTKTDNTSSATNLDDNTGTMTLAMAAHEIKTLQTPPVTRSVSNTAKTAVDEVNYTGAIKATTTSVTTDVIGYYMEAKINGQIVAKSMDPDDILDKVGNAVKVAPPSAAPKKAVAAAVPPAASTGK